MNIKLPYSLEELRKLELSIIKWLQNIGLESVLKKKPISILDIEPEIRNGTLLCELAEKLGGKHITGIFKDPKTDTIALSNLRKACECIRSLHLIKHK